ncbi:hypothetical protein, partial [Brevibacillus brevis]
ILIRISAYARKGKRFDYSTHDRLREAIEKKLFAIAQMRLLRYVGSLLNR